MVLSDALQIVCGDVPQDQLFSCRLLWAGLYLLFQDGKFNSIGVDFHTRYVSKLHLYLASSKYFKKKNPTNFY